MADRRDPGQRLLLLRLVGTDDAPPAPWELAVRATPLALTVLPMAAFSAAALAVVLRHRRRARRSNGRADGGRRTALPGRHPPRRGVPAGAGRRHGLRVRPADPAPDERTRPPREGVGRARRGPAAHPRPARRAGPAGVGRPRLVRPRRGLPGRIASSPAGGEPATDGPPRGGPGGR
ncbi:hypothetical protein NKH77_27455 [Streptomyces sp. M19]